MATKYMWLLAAILCKLSLQIAFAAPAPNMWDQPAAALAEKISAILGPGEARLTIRNLSSISADEIPTIRRQLETDLKAHGVSVSGADSASSIRVTLSESANERLWVAEITEGNQTQVAMVNLGPIQPARAPVSAGILLRKQTILTAQEPLLSALEVPGGFLVLEPEQIVFFARVPDGLKASRQARVLQKSPLARDPRGILRLSADGQEIDAWLPGEQCTGQLGAADLAGAWAVRCYSSDDPWPLLSNAVAPALNPGTNSPAGAQSLSLKAFYNTARNYFTGVITPAVGFDVPPFYAAAPLSRASTGSSFPIGEARLLLAGVDGQVRLIDAGSLHAVAGTRDWGSDFAVLQSGCGAGEQIIASGSGEATHDSLRAYELPAFEAVPASAPLAMDGSVMALWTSPDEKSVFAAVRKTANQYEVDRVSALCN